MRRRNFALPAIAFFGLLIFFCLLIRLLLLRYERGDIYPPYSTLRADPLGTRAYFEALGSLDRYPVSRGFSSLKRELKTEPGTLFYLGVDASMLRSFSRDELAQLDDYVRNGGRIVLTFQPEDPITGFEEIRKPKAPIDRNKKDADEADKKTPQSSHESSNDEKESRTQTRQEKYERDSQREEEEKAKKDSPSSDTSSSSKYRRSLNALWGFGWDWHREKRPEKKGGEASFFNPGEETEKPEVLAKQVGEGKLEPSIPWKSALYFIRLEPEWQELYTAKDKPVLIRRSWGKGEIIVASDSYLVSNEALRNDRRTALLGLLAGPPGRLLFDETHLGTQQQEGVMYLAEKYRLEGYLGGMLVVVLLLLWRNSIPLVPPHAIAPEATLGGTVSGKDSRSGLVNLLRRNIPAADLLKTSLAEWRRQLTPGRPHLQDKLKAMESIISATDTKRGDHLIQSYHQLREINKPVRAQGIHATRS